MDQPKSRRKSRRRGNGVTTELASTSNAEPQTSYASTYSTLLAPLEAIGQLPLVDLSTTLSNIKTATAELVLHPINFKAILMASINRSIGFKKTLTTGEDSYNNKLVNGEENQSQSNRSSLYQTYLQKKTSNVNSDEDDENWSHVQDSTKDFMELENSDIEVDNSETGSQIEDKQKVNLKLDKLNSKREKVQYKLVHLQVELDKLITKKTQLEAKLVSIDKSIEFGLKELETLEFEKLIKNSQDVEQESLNEEISEPIHELEDTDLQANVTETVKVGIHISGPELIETETNVEVKLNSQSFPDIVPDTKVKTDLPRIQADISEESDKMAELDTISNATSTAISSPFQDWQAHETCITSLFQDPTGPLLVTSAMDGTIRLWSEPEPTFTNQVYSALPQYRHFTLQSNLDLHQGAVYSVKILDGILVSAGQDTTVRVWNCRHLLDDTETQVDEDQDVDPMFDNGNRSPLLSPSPARTPQSNHSPTIGSRRFSNTNSSASLAVPPSVDLPTKACDLIPAFTLKGHRSYVRCLDMDDKSIISGSNDGTMRQWDLESGRMLNTFDPTWTSHNPNLTLGRNRSLEALQAKGPQYEALASTVGALQFFKHGLASGTSDGIVRMWDLRTGQPHRQLTGHTSPITDLKFDFHHLVSASLDRSVKIWDLRAGKVLEQLKFDDLVTSIQFDTHRILAACNKPNISMYDRTTFHTKLILPNQNKIWALHLNESRMFTGDITGAVRLHTF